jgi:NADH pyrophosphatase NudC (nudix superfamily)
VLRDDFDIQEVLSMATWTCPNTKCTYNGKLEHGQHCPLCGKEAQKFSFNELGNLLKEKDNFRKSAKRTKEHKDLLKRIKFCPKCGSTNINFPIFYRPSIWKCLDCGYEGAVIIEDGEFEKK